MSHFSDVEFIFKNPEASQDLATEFIIRHIVINVEKVFHIPALEGDRYCDKLE